MRSLHPHKGAPSLDAGKDTWPEAEHSSLISSLRINAAASDRQMEDTLDAHR
jgi:hypothetical protein